ncbi:MAG: type III secretion system export apparatus subunit SctT [Pseudomonadota bacterium]
MNDFEVLSLSLSSFALSLARLGAAFLILPLMTSEVVSPMVRNVFFVSLALAVMPLVSATVPEQPLGAMVVPILLKEVFIGLVLGYTFGLIFWALEGAGEIIDAKVGTTTAQIVDPLLGHQTSLMGAFLGRLTAFLFVAMGGLLVFIGLVLESFTLWPVDAPFPVLRTMGVDFFIHKFDEFVAITLILATPVLLALTLVEFGLGFINRYAPQLNVFSLSLSLKAWLAVMIIMLMIPFLVEYIGYWFSSQKNLGIDLSRVLSP